MYKSKSHVVKIHKIECILSRFSLPVVHCLMPPPAPVEAVGSDALSPTLICCSEACALYRIGLV